MPILKNFRETIRDYPIFGLQVLLFLLCSLLVITVFPDPVETPHMAIASVLIGISIIIIGYKAKFSTTFSKPILLFISLFWIWALLSLLASQDIVNSIAGVSSRMTSSVWFFSLLFILALILSGFPLTHLKTLIKVVVIISFFGALVAVLQYFGVGLYQPNATEARVLIPSLFGNPNFGAMFISTTFFFSLWWLQSTQSIRIRIFLGTVLCSQLISLIFFASRGAILGLISGCIILFSLKLVTKHYKVALGVLLVVLFLGIVSYPFFQSLRNDVVIEGVSDTSAQQRWYIWDHAFSTIKQYPYFGTGLGNYLFEYRQSSASYFSTLGWFDDPHNLFLHLSVQGGLPHALLFLIMNCLALWKVYRNIKTERESVYLYSGLALVAWLVAVSFNPVTISNWIIWSLLLVIIFSGNKGLEVKFGKLSRAGLYLGGSLFIIVGVLFLLSDILLWQGTVQLNQDKQETAIRFYKLSTLLNPTNTAAWNSYGAVTFRAKDFHTTEEVLNTLDHLHPYSTWVIANNMYGYANLWFQDRHNLEKKQLVYKTLWKYIDSYPYNATTYFNAMKMYMNLGDYSRAEESARKYVVLSHGYYESWIALANVYQATGQTEKSTKALDRAFLAAPTPELREAQKINSNVKSN